MIIKHTSTVDTPFLSFCYQFVATADAVGRVRLSIIGICAVHRPGAVLCVGGPSRYFVCGPMLWYRIKHKKGRERQVIAKKD
jgi:hypothetical protein